jgi:hypothetical protein
MNKKGNFFYFISIIFRIETKITINKILKYNNYNFIILFYYIYIFIFSFKQNKNYYIHYMHYKIYRSNYKNKITNKSIHQDIYFQAIIRQVKQQE